MTTASEPTFSWARQLPVGKAGEQAVIAWLEGQGYEVEDVSDDKQWQRRDVDFHISKDGVRLTAEVKTDTHAPNNLFLELTDDGRPGYLYKSRADVLLYYFPGSGKLYWLSMATLAWWVHDNATGLRRIEVRSKRRGGGEPWVSVGIAVPVASLRDAGLLKEYDVV